MLSSCLIVGAGISGLTAGTEMQKRGLRVTVLEKSRGVGGRMATRRTDRGVFDHGAQFITARSRDFMALVEDWQAAGLLARWTDTFADLRPGALQDPAPRFTGVGGMTSVPKHLAGALDVRLERRVTRVRENAGSWSVTTDGGEEYSAEALLLTAPLPQSLAILDAGGTPLDASLQPHLRSISYNSCIALLVELEGPSNVPPPGGMLLGPEPIRWMADNRSKGVSADAVCLTIHAGPSYSEENFAAEPEAIADSLLQAAGEFLGSPVRTTNVHRWRYSEPQHTFPQRALLVQETPPLLLAGDSFGGPRVEGAALSGLAASTTLLTLMQEKR